MDDRKLEANEFLYGQALIEAERLVARGHPTTLEAIERAARIAWFYHPGRFADGALENRLLEAGQQLGTPTPEGAEANQREMARPPHKPSKTLHVATEVYRTGGHTRLLAEWIRRDTSVQHQLVLTRQAENIPGFLAELCEERGVDIVELDPELPVADRARSVRAMAASATGVGLHHSPDDAVPVVAFAIPGGPPVVMCNHAHFSFSLGTSVSDLVLNTIPYYADVSRESRFAQRVEVVPMGAFGVLDAPPVDKTRAKLELGFLDDGPILLTIGNEAYYRPTPEMDFFDTLRKLMERRSDFEVIFVGARETSDLVPKWLKKNSRAHLVGIVDDPTPYYRAADLCLESFPTPSLGALVESVVIGAACPVFSYAERENILRPNLSPRFLRARSEAEYLDEVCRRLDGGAETSALVEDERKDLSEQATRTLDYWTSLTRRLFEIEHRPRPLPVTSRENEYDNVLLSRSGRDDIGDHLLGLCLDEPWRAVRSHVHAMAEGYEGYGMGALRLLRVAFRTVRRTLGLTHGAVRRRVIRDRTPSTARTSSPSRNS